MHDTLRHHHAAWQPTSNRLKGRVFLASMDLQPLMNASFCFNFMTITSLLYDQKLHHTSLAMTSHKS